MVIRLGQKGMLDHLEKGITNGSVVLLENIGEVLDPVLDPLLTRNLIKKGRLVYLRVIKFCCRNFLIIADVPGQ